MKLKHILFGVALSSLLCFINHGDLIQTLAHQTGCQQPD
jgi:hypothetical protein